MFALLNAFKLYVILAVALGLITGYIAARKSPVRMVPKTLPTQHNDN